MRRQLLVCTALVFAVTLSSSSPAAESTATEMAIRESARVFTEAFNQGKADAVAAQWTPDGEYIIGSQSLKGREAIARIYGEYFRAHPGAKMEVTVESIRAIAPTVAIEQGTASTTESPGGTKTASSYTAVHVKQGDKWLMANVRESEMPAVTVAADLSQIAWVIGTWAAEGDAGKAEMNYDWMAGKHFIKGQITLSTKDGSASGGTQIIGKDPVSGRLVSWFFSADGGHAYGQWSQEGSRWIINTEGMTADGAPTMATNILYRADDKVASWQSVDRSIGQMRLPNTREVVLERVSGGNGN